MKKITFLIAFLCAAMIIPPIQVLADDSEEAEEETHPVLDEESAKNLYPPEKEPLYYNITFDSCNGSEEWTWGYEKNAAIGRLPAYPQKQGYLFTGWYTEKEGGTRITVETVITSDMMAYAHWEKIEDGCYTVYFDKNYETDSPIYRIWITPEIVSDDKVKREGYVFTGWYTERTGGKKVKDGMKVTHDMTVYAHWSKVTVKKAVIQSVKSLKKKHITVTFKKIAGAEGYQIQLSTSKKFTEKNTTTKTYTDCKVFTRTIGKLKSKKTYYVRVRAYKKDSTDANIYGKWSNIKRVKTKK